MLSPQTLYMSAGKINCPIVFRGPNGAAAGVGAQHSQCFAAWFSHCPGLKVRAWGSGRLAPLVAAEQQQQRLARQVQSTSGSC